MAVCQKDKEIHFWTKENNKLLNDKDRIFTNLYGLQDWDIQGAEIRGDWDNTKALIDMGSEKIKVPTTPYYLSVG